MIDYERIENINTENIIFLIYYIIITISIYANEIEKKYLIYHNNKDKEIYRILLSIVFIIAVFVYIYYIKSNVKDLKKSKTIKEKELNTLSLIASILIFISGIIYLYIIKEDKNIDIEIAFN